MSAPNTTPTPQPQPQTQFYGLNILGLFTTYTRAQLAALGVTVPPGDPTKPAKGWSDTTPGAGNYGAYDSLSGDWVPFTVLDPVGFNLPGSPAYPPYAPAATSATWGVGGNTVDPTELSTSQQMDDLLTAWTVGDPNATPVIYNLAGFTFQANGETRKTWQIVYKGVPIFVGHALEEMDAKGQGAPGHWDFSGAEPVWVSDVPAAGTVLPPAQPIPMRQINTMGAVNEIIAGGLMGAQVERTDIVPTPAPGGFSTMDRANIQAILAAVQKP